VRRSETSEISNTQFVHATTTSTSPGIAGGNPLFRRRLQRTYDTDPLFRGVS
jgi:hypothetical protein